MSADDPAPRPTTEPIPWPAQVWLGLPFVLVTVGGALGGGLGGAAWGLNQVLYRKSRNPLVRYGLTGLISAGAVVAYLTLAPILLEALGAR